MNLQSSLERAFAGWCPSTPEVMSRNKRDVTLTWQQEDLEFLSTEDLLYRLERKEKMPPWVVVYRGSKTVKQILDLAPCSPHKFRLRVIVRTEAVPNLAENAAKYYGNEEIAFEKLKSGLLKSFKDDVEVIEEIGGGDCRNDDPDKEDAIFGGTGDNNDSSIKVIRMQRSSTKVEKKSFLGSQWSEEICTSTESEGTSSTCFCMAIRGGYLKQVQMLLEERPELLGIINSTNGFTPLATAVRKGDINIVRYLLSMGAEVDQRSTTGQTPLHLSVLGSHTNIADLLIEKGANVGARDLNDLRVEHYAVDSGDLHTVRHILDQGDLHVIDNNGWTPLFRAIIQGASTEIIDELVQRGAEVDIYDAAGLSLSAAARIIAIKHGHTRESVMRMVDAQYPHEKAVANFTRLTKKISSLHTLFKA